MDVQDSEDSPNTSSVSEPSMDREDVINNYDPSDAEGSEDLMATPLAEAEAEDEEDNAALAQMLEDFPMADFVTVSEGLTRNPNWTVYPSQLSNCLTAAVRIASSGEVAADNRSDTPLLCSTRPKSRSNRPPAFLPRFQTSLLFFLFSLHPRHLRKRAHPTCSVLLKKTPDEHAVTPSLPHPNPTRTQSLASMDSCACHVML